MLKIRQTSAIYYDIMGSEGGDRLDKEFEEKITYIVGELRSAGYDPYAQLSGFIRTQDDRYITRRGNARSLILEIDLNLLRQYMMQMD